MKKNLFKKIVSLSEQDLEKFVLSNLKPDILEIRLDLFSNYFLEKKIIPILKKRKEEILFTYRLTEDSNLSSVEPIQDLVLEKLLKEFNIETNYIDFELDKKNLVLEKYKSYKFKKIFSIHDFLNKISNLHIKNYIIKNHNKEAIYKVAKKIDSINELFLFLNDMSEFGNDFNLILIPMGELGMLVRLFPDRFQSIATYTCFEEPKAPGQIQLIKFDYLRNKIDFKENLNKEEYLKLKEELKFEVKR